ncbi:hypothetical protein [Acinetobacter schindleri]|jgi:hypothetical protein|uniref:hypothetical protein n=1 Tax=Acinetobacter schindleri TaxID=108981 RepID=UPI00289DD973|nr:hypothetical protein [Acinetobacter schindleri]
MAMKQTQTKLFDFSDVGLDFSAGSKNLFPDCFKKMLSLGYNVQTVTSVAVAGNQVTFTYGGAHGYAADRVLKVDSGSLSLINEGEFWIDSVTTNTVTITLDDAPISIVGGFMTRVASLGWSLVYEQSNIHIYKFKKIDDTDTYLRICYQTNMNQRNCMIVGVGDTVDLSLGVITDDRCMPLLAQAATVDQDPSSYKWEFGGMANATHNSATYGAGFETYGKAVVVGSKYHFLSMHNVWLDAANGNVCAVLPFHTSYSDLNVPAIIANAMGATTGNIAYGDLLSNSSIISGRYICRGTPRENRLLATNDIKANFLPNAIETFNTTTTRPVFVYEGVTGQFVGVLYGINQALYGVSTNAPSSLPSATPSQTIDVDASAITFVHVMSMSSTRVYFAVPVEEIKIV